MLFNMTIDNVSLEFKLFDPISQRYLQAMSVPLCAVGKLILVDDNDPEKNNSTFKIYTKDDNYFSTDIACC